MLIGPGRRKEGDGFVPDPRRQAAVDTSGDPMSAASVAIDVDAMPDVQVFAALVGRIREEGGSKFGRALHGQVDDRLTMRPSVLCAIAGIRAAAQPASRRADGGQGPQHGADSLVPEGHAQHGHPHARGHESAG